MVSVSVNILSLLSVDLGLVDKAKEIVAKLILAGGYNPEAYENPVLQKHYASLQALALDQDVPEEIVDKTIPDLQLIHQRAGSLLEQFHDLLVPSGRKRKGSLEEESSPVQVNLYEQVKEAMGSATTVKHAFVDSIF